MFKVIKTIIIVVWLFCITMLGMMGYAIYSVATNPEGTGNVIGTYVQEFGEGFSEGITD